MIQIDIYDKVGIIQEKNVILFLHGSDTFRSLQKLKEIVQKYKTEVDPQGYNLEEFYGKEIQIDQLIKTLRTTPFLASKRMTVIHEYTQIKADKEEKQSLANICQDLLEEDHIFVVWEQSLKKSQLKDAVLKVVNKSKFIMEFTAYNQAQLLGWFNAELQKEGINLMNDAGQYISASIQDNAWKANQEVKKLIAYCKANNHTQLSLDIAKLLIPSPIKDDIFALVDAVSQKQLAQGLARLEQQFKSGNHELQLLSMLFRQFRLLQQIKSGLKEYSNPTEIAKAYGIHPYVVKKLHSIANQIPQADIIKAFDLFNKIDEKVKTSNINTQILLHQALIKIMG